jgi:carbonic anhydrase
LKPISILAVILTLLAACSSKTQDSPHWTYEGEEGPEHWDDLDPSYAICGTGIHQSPIEISSTNEKDLPNIVFHYESSQVNIFNNGHTVQVNYDVGSYIELDDVRYDLLQFHYHTPSEHMINGKSFPAEIHLVHENMAKELAVVGVLLQEGTKNSAFEPFINNLPAEKSDVKDAGVKINANDFLPSIQTTFRYNGSLTTPPCSEGVSWLLMTTPVELSSEQLSELESIFEEGNNRPVQPLNNRSLEEDSTP